MKKIILSAAVAAMAFSTSAMAADKGIDIDVSGQATVYYETHSSNATGDKGQFDQANSTAAAGVQLNLGSDLGNNFTFGSQITYLGSLGLEKDVVGGLKQQAGTGVQGATTADLALTKMFIAKQVGNTTLKLGRQELPMSLSPLAYSEGWNVYKNTFDAVIAVNTDLPSTTLVGAYVSGGTAMSLGTTSNLTAVTTAGSATVAGSAYMITAATTVIPMTTLTLSMYDLENVGANLLGAGDDLGAKAYWADAQIAPKDAPAGLKVALQAGKIAPENSSRSNTAFDDTTAFGAKVTANIGAIGLKAIYTSVDAPATGKQAVSVQNTGTGIKSPLYSQMMYNQNMISLDSDTIVLGASYDLGEMGNVSANYGMTTMDSRNTAATNNNTDYNELDLVYKVKAGGVQYFAIAAIRDIDTGGTLNTTTGSLGTTATDDTVLRFWARYNF